MNNLQRSLFLLCISSGTMTSVMSSDWSPHTPLAPNTSLNTSYSLCQYQIHFRQALSNFSENPQQNLATIKSCLGQGKVDSHFVSSVIKDHRESFGQYNTYNDVYKEAFTAIAQKYPYALWQSYRLGNNNHTPMFTESFIEEALNAGWMIPYQCMNNKAEPIPIVHYYIVNISNAEKNANNITLNACLKKIQYLCESGFNPYFEQRYPLTIFDEPHSILVSSYTLLNHYPLSDATHQNIISLFNSSKRSPIDTENMFYPGTQFCYKEKK